MRIFTSALLLCAAAAAQGTQMPIPGFDRTFSSSSLTRGLYFEYPATGAPFIISGLRVPDETGDGTQNVEVFIMSSAPPAFSATATGGSVFYANNQPSANIIPTSITVNPGDWVGVLGACGTSTMRNSYGPTGTFTSSILGTPVDLNRFITQTNLNTSGGNQPYSANDGGNLGRVEVYYTPAAGLFPSFVADVQSGSSPLTVNFTDTSFSSDPNGIQGWVWDLDGDGTPDSNAQNPTFTYNSCGTFDVSLTVVDVQHGQQSITQTAFIETDPNSGASFTVADLGGSTFQFTDTSVGATAWAWDFDGDSTIDSTLQNPTHTYPTATTVQVSLTATFACRNETATQSLYTGSVLCTTFAGGNGLSGSGAGNLFDVLVTNPNGLAISGLDVSAGGADTAGTVWVYLAPVSYVGNETNPAAWTLVAEVTGVNLTGGNGSQDFVDIPDLYLPPGSYGMSVRTSEGVRYTNGSNSAPASNLFSNADLTIAAGGGQGGLFTGSTFNPRMWNGCIYYSTTSYYAYHKAGCDGSAGRTTLTSAAPPAIGQTLTVDVQGMPANSFAFLVLGYTDQTIIGPNIPLPLDLTPFGLAGCNLNVEPFTGFLVLGDGAGNGQWNLPIPAVPAFVGAEFWNQALVSDPGFNLAEAVMSDSAVGRVGS